MVLFQLKIVDLFRWLFIFMNVDYQQLRAILTIKLMMDNRRQSISYRRKEGKETNNSFLYAVIIYMVFGLFMGLAILYKIPSLMLSMTLFFAYIMVMISMTLITDFSSILLDTSDNTIILPRPVDGRTLFVARITHILLYLGQLTLALSAVPAIVVTMRYGVAFLPFFLLAIMLSVLLAVFITNAIYLLIMQFSSEEKLKNTINYFQIIMAVFIMGGYQLLPRFMGSLDFVSYVFVIQWWSYIVPPVWMAGALESFQLMLLDWPHFFLTLLAVCIPILGIYFTNKYLTPIFNRKLSAMGGDIESRQSLPIEKRSESISMSGKISLWVTSNLHERGAFELIYKILGRDRKIKLKIYPVFGYIFVFGLVFMVRGKEDIITTWNNLPTTHYYLVLIYFTFIISQVALREITYSDEYKASWIYFSTPIESPGEILSGVLKAIFLKLFVPVYLIFSVFILFVWGIVALDDIVLGFINNFIILLVIAMVGNRYLPLTMESSAKAQSGNFMRGIMMIIAMAIPGLLHYLLTSYPLYLMASIPLQFTVGYFLLKSYKGTTWSRIKT